MKIIAFYLPQYYPFPENDKWWGKGFTEWTNVKKSKPLFKGHYQPTVPLNKNYYSLEDINTMKWQVELARKYMISGFCFYHYWFGEGRQLMEKPVEAYLDHHEIDFPFCLCWANHNWSRTWVGGDSEILMEVKYGDKEEWEKHFQYLLQFFKDNRYIRINNKPVFILYQPQLIKCYHEMLSYFQVRAREEGLEGITIIAQSMFKKESNDLESFIDYKIEYEPNYSRMTAWENKKQTFRTSIWFFLDLAAYKVKGYIKKATKEKVCRYRTYSYDAIWHYMLNKQVQEDKMIAGAFVKCDVTPRRQERALIYKGASPEKFEKYLKKLVKKVRLQYKLNYVFLSAWNEWGEGMYLEPDEKYQYKYLEAIKNALNKE